MKIANEKKFIDAMAASEEIAELRRLLLNAIRTYRYTYNFTWLGQPIIQIPDDIIAVGELIYSVKPDLIIETGIAHGGSLLYSASMLELLGGNRCVVGVDIEIRKPNREAIEMSSLAHRIILIEGSSTDLGVVSRIQELAKRRRSVMVFLDSNHTHEHVTAELQLYGPLVTKGSYMVVFDTAIEDVTDGDFTGRSWGKGNNPKTAVWAFLKTSKRFEIDHEVEEKLIITGNPNGFLRCVKD